MARELAAGRWLRVPLPPDSSILRLIWLLTGISVLHAPGRWEPPGLETAMTSWLPVLVDALAVCLLAGLAADLAPGRRRLAWRLVLVAVGFDFVSTVLWAIPGDPHQILKHPVAFLLALSFYPVAAVAGVLFFLDLGGSFRRWTTWIDIVTLVLGVGVLLWYFYLDPLLQSTGHAGPGQLMFIAYVAGIWLVTVIAALVAMTISDWRVQVSRAILVIAAIIGFIGHMGWIAALQREQFQPRAWYGIVGSVIPYCLLGISIHFERMHGDRVSRGGLQAETSLSFLPSLLALIIIALLLDEAADLKGASSAVLGILMVSGIALAGMQHRVHRFEFAGLQRALTVHNLEIGLSELVRRSSDLITLVGTDRRLAYASPAAAEVVGRSAEALRRQPARELLGHENAARMDRMLDAIFERCIEQQEFETSFVDPQGLTHAVRVVGSGRLDNPDIAGVVLTLHEITDEQRLEREVLDCSSRERSRLSSDVHDGVGQELTGIALLLKSLDLEVERSRGSLARSLDQIEQHVCGAIRLTRRLESGLAALPASHGTLEGMLEHLAAEARGRFGFGIGFQPAALCCELGVAEAEHLYRIAQESINNAARHSGCRSAWIRIERSADGVAMTIDDDGCGFECASADSGGLGMRMMRYRAQILGAHLQVESVRGRGTRIAVILPCSRVSPDSLPSGSI